MSGQALTRERTARHKRSRLNKALLSSVSFRVVHLMFDIVALVLAWKATLEVRLFLNPYMAQSIPPSRMAKLAPSVGSLVVVWLLCSAWRQAYGRHQDRSVLAGLMKVAESAILVGCAATVLTFFSRHLGADLSRSFVFLFTPLSFLAFLTSFFLSLAVAWQIEHRCLTRVRVAVLGTGREAEEVVAAMGDLKGNSISLRGLILPERTARETTAAEGAIDGLGLPVLGTTKDLAAVINRECIDRIIVATDRLTEREAERCGNVSRRMGITVSRPIQPPASDVLVRHEIEYGLHLISLEAAPFTRWEEVLKRGVDLLLASAMLVALFPVMVLIASLIRITSAGPAIYRSRRVGKGGRHFDFWKFRTMYASGPRRSDLTSKNESNGHLFKMRSDPRVTPIGRFLRRFSLDELPQFVNVVAGHMSLVGPRPLPIEDLDPDGMSQSFAKWAVERSGVRPGITGLWQVRGRSDLPFNSMVDLDLEYIRNWSIGLDLSILCATPRAVISARGAY